MTIIQMPLPYSGGQFVTASRRAVWHTTEGGSAAGAFSAYKSQGFCPHFTWDSVTGQIWQHLSLDVAATTLKNEAGGVQTNRDGAIQIEVVGFAIHPFTLGPCNGLFELMVLLRGVGIPDVWPMGPPKPYPASYGLNNGDRDAHIWDTTPGHYSHSQVPENDHGDPGAIDPTRLFGTNPVPAPKELPDMFVTKSSNGTCYFVTNDGFSKLEDVKTFENLQKAGVKYIAWDDKSIANAVAKIK